MDTNKIMEALEFGIGLASARRYETGKDHSMVIRAFQEAIAELDKAQQPGKVLTDEEIERIARYEFRRVSDQDGLHDDNADKRDAFADGLRYARDNYGIGTPAAGLTDEEIEHIADVEHVDSGNRMSGMWRDGFVEGLRHARDHYGIGAPAAGLTVDEAMEALQEHIDREGWAMTEPNRWRFRARLTAALEAKTRTA